MAEKPLNEHLWATVVMQAKQKYATYPSPGASHFVHQRYVELGGKFETHDENSKRRDALKKKFQDRIREKAAHGNHDPRDNDIHEKDKKSKKDKK